MLFYSWCDSPWAFTDFIKCRCRCRCRWRENPLGATKFCVIRDQNCHHFWNQGSKTWVKIRDQRWKHISRYDPETRHSWHGTCSAADKLHWRMKLQEKTFLFRNFWNWMTAYSEVEHLMFVFRKTSCSVAGRRLLRRFVSVDKFLSSQRQVGQTWHSQLRTGK